MRVGVIGTGHVGLVTCASLGVMGHDVVGTDADEEKITALRRGVAPFFEPGLEELVAQAVEEERLRFTSDPEEAVGEAEATFICVGTPPRSSGEANLVAVEQSARVVARHATQPVVVVEKSTVPAGTFKRLRRALSQERPELKIEVASNPEFLREGKAVEDSLQPDRILVGAESDWALEVMRRVYKPWIDQGVRYIQTDVATAEMAKHACNAFLALKISFANALARLCERADADVVSVTEVMGADDRIGREFLNAGIGWGGSCFPKDLIAFERLALKLGYDFPLLREVHRINDDAVQAVFEKVKEALWNLEDKTITLFGLAFKPDTDDVRYAPALTLAKALLAEGARVVGYDPQAGANAKAEVPDLEIASDPYEAATEAHCIVLCTEWDEFKNIDLTRLKEIMTFPVVIDGRNLYDAHTMRAAGITYYPTGRPAVA